ncbi:MAG: hydrolase [Chitinophagaceae bacterium]|nr:hydrolase [Chitinophagaceae bacterium]
MKQSAGILLYKQVNKKTFVFLVHPGGPLWKNKDLESWSIPKGEFVAPEKAMDAALREFEEETGQAITAKEFIELKPVKLKSGKTVYAWACEQDIDADAIKSNTFSLEWPPKSGRFNDYPEIDRAEWFELEEALKKINPAQQDFIRELILKTANLQ